MYNMSTCGFFASFVTWSVRKSFPFYFICWDFKPRTESRIPLTPVLEREIINSDGRTELNRGLWSEDPFLQYKGTST